METLAGNGLRNYLSAKLLGVMYHWILSRYAFVVFVATIVVNFIPVKGKTQ